MNEFGELLFALFNIDRKGGNILLDSPNGTDDARLLLLSIVLDELLELVELALNDGTTAGCGIWGKPQDVALVLENLIDLLEPDMVDHDTAHFLKRRLLHDSSDATEGVAHDGDKQVQED